MEQLCSKCSDKKLYKKGMCRSCYYYFNNGGEQHIPPKKGKMFYVKNGKAVCHICGRAYKRLGMHIVQFHKMSVEDYSKIYNLGFNRHNGGFFTKEENM